MSRPKIFSFLLSQFHKIFLIFGRRKRFVYALRLMKIVEPLVSKFSYYAMPSVALGTRQEYLAAALLNSMTYHNVEFDPVITVRGTDLIPPDGAIFIGGHFYLNFIFMRWLYDIGRQPTVFLLTGTDEWRIMGTKVPFEILKSEGISLIYVKHRISAGKLIAAVIDNPFPYPNWKKLNIPDVDIYVTDALIKLAERIKAPIFFFDTYFDKDDNVIANIVEASSNKTDVVLNEFSNFISSALENRSGF